MIVLLLSFATTPLCPPCRLSLHSHHGHPESPDGADYTMLHNIQHSVGETEKMSINTFYCIFY